MMARAGWLAGHLFASSVISDISDAAHLIARL